MRQQKKHKPRIPLKKYRDRHARVIGIVLTLVFVYLIYNIYVIQNVEGDELRRRASRQHTRVQQSRANREIPAARGGIMDRHMQPLVSSIPVFEIFIDVNLLHSAGEIAIHDHVSALHRELGLSTLELMAYFETDAEGELIHTHGASHRIVARDIEAEVAIPLRDSYRHIHATQTSLRHFHDPFFAPQVIGFVRGDARMGLEASFNDVLTGFPGRTYFVQGEIHETPVRNGHTIVTTLDSDIQRIAQEHVNRAYIEMDAEFAAMIVMNPNTGEILAMAQAPTFSIADPLNPNTTTDRFLQQNWDNLSPEARSARFERMWQNFHVTRAYEPGSIFKPFVIAAAFEESVLDTTRTFTCNRIMHIYGEELRCWTHHGPLSLRQAIYRSCNKSMFYIVEMLGRDCFYRYRGYFGFGFRTEIDLPAEQAVNSPYVMYTLGRLNRVERATSSMGQGFNATSLQSITGYAALINGGYLLRPFVVSHVVDEFGNIVEETDRKVVRNVLSGRTSDFIRREMQYVVSAPGGTANPHSVLPGHSIGGKTGTGQQGVRAAGVNSLTYVAFTPVENPEFLVLMVADRVDYTLGGAGQNIGPRVRDFLEDVISVRGIAPSDGAYAFDAWRTDIMGAPQMPDYSGQRLVDAVRDLSNRSSGGFQVIGTGTVVSHTIPSPGRELPQTSPVIFYMEEGTRLEGHMVNVPNLVGRTVAQAEAILQELGLPPVLLGSLVPPGSNANDTPHTGNVERGENSDSDQAAPQPIILEIYQQFPAPETEVERGTMVMIRAR